MVEILLYTFFGTLFMFLMTTLGASLIFFIKKNLPRHINSLLLGLAGGVMIAASIFSLIIPAIEESKSQSGLYFLPPLCGMLLGFLFLFSLDYFTPNAENGDLRKQNKMMFISVTLHNIPEGMIVGLSFALALSSNSVLTTAGAIALAIGIGIQNFPEGFAVSLPYLTEGRSKRKAFFYGMISGIVEPIFGIGVIFFVSFFAALLPWLLSFAAGAMIFVVVKELIPSAHYEGKIDLGTAGFALGFLIMMTLDLALG